VYDGWELGSWIERSRTNATSSFGISPIKNIFGAYTTKRLNHLKQMV
jgi:hypothetical protein